MNKKFLSSGVYEVLEELSRSAGHSYEYGRLVALTSLCFDEELVVNKGKLLNELRKQARERDPLRRQGPYEW
jgi:hypothetical protein